MTVRFSIGSQAIPKSMQSSNFNTHQKMCLYTLILEVLGFYIEIELAAYKMLTNLFEV